MNTFFYLLNSLFSLKKKLFILSKYSCTSKFNSANSQINKINKTTSSHIKHAKKCVHIGYQNKNKIKITRIRNYFVYII